MALKDNEHFKKWLELRAQHRALGLVDIELSILHSETASAILEGAGKFQEGYLAGIITAREIIKERFRKIEALQDAEEQAYQREEE
ncbi:hypothetical protein [Pectinatus frisingensis]|uniref:hypothetical protein n=1 Tax=Pectinatus frisingensis TaxID=865 RepID=UPI0018C64234|nr:hypothetical protein [Pectinatus frisingensis]